MTIKTVNLDEKIYAKLMSQRKGNETISDVIARLLGGKEEKKDIRKAFGLWKDIPDELIKLMKSANKELREEINQRFDIN